MFDLAIVGSGFAGSLMAMVARRMGRSVVLIERGKHPRIAIGESSTPLANLLLEELATRYDLPLLLPLTKWGSWQRTYPHLACGLKRGFSFFHHQLGQPWLNDPGRADQLLVGASPNEEIADTHWYRAEFDEFLARSALDLGAEFIDEVDLRGFTANGNSVRLDGRRKGIHQEFKARFVIDATGPRGFLHRALHLSEAPLPHLPPTEGLYAHFSGVRRFADGAQHIFKDSPYPIDEAAVHHVFDGGWAWVLQFNNGVTSAGVATTASRARKWKLESGAPAWKLVLQDIPSLGEQFSRADQITPFHYEPRLAFRSSCWAGESWIQLPSAGGFIDPLLSTGFPLAMFGVARMAEAIKDDWNTVRFAPRVKSIARENEDDFLAAEQLVAALYAQMNDFPVFRALTLLYFAAASFSESARRLGRSDLHRGFLMHADPRFGTALRDLCSLAICGISTSERAAFMDKILRAIEPINIAGLGQDDRRHWYPVDLQDLISSAEKLGVSETEMRAMIRRVTSTCR